MNRSIKTGITAIALCTMLAPAMTVAKEWKDDTVQLGPRPFFLFEVMDAGALKDKLSSCQKGPFKQSDFSIGHRGAPMQFPEHTMESYTAAARMGAGILECDVTFTKDRELVCRHSQCDLHTTTNILEIPALAAKCSVPFTPADPVTGTPASARCCTSDITLAEFKTLKGKMDTSDSSATTVAEYMGGTADWRTEVYTSRGTLLTHAESIELFKSLDAKMTPELKTPSVTMPYEGDYTQEDYAQQMIDEYKAAGVDPGDVWAQSFLLEDIEYWIANEPEFGMQTVYLDDRYDDPTFDHTNPATYDVSMVDLAASGVKIIAPPLWILLALDGNGDIVPSVYAIEAKAAGLDIITWTFEHSNLLDGAKPNGVPTWYYQTVADAIQTDGDMYNALDVLAKDVGILGIFSDWPATVTYYANCMGLK
jgi:glycerophosphoryl diester phosphodiesterase